MQKNLHGVIQHQGEVLADVHKSLGDALKDLTENRNYPRENIGLQSLHGNAQPRSLLEEEDFTGIKPEIIGVKSSLMGSSLTPPGPGQSRTNSAGRRSFLIGFGVLIQMFWHESSSLVEIRLHTEFGRVWLCRS